jgi:hypothetical protein
MHLHLIIACSVVESINVISELNKLTEVFAQCHQNIVMLIEILNE